MDNFFKGVIPALPTPFDKGGKIVEAPLRKHTRACLDAGVDGLFVCGSTGCGPFINTEEHREVTRIVVDEVAGQAVVFMLVGGLSTSDAAEMGRAGADAGADAVASLPPLECPATVPVIAGHLTAVTEAAGLPIVYYHYPAGTHVQLGAKELIELARSVPNLLGIKFADPALVKAFEVRIKLPDIHLCVGAEETLLGALALGAADGTVSSTVNYMPEPVVQVRRWFFEGRFDEARTLSQRVALVGAAYGTVGWVPGAYAICNLLGLEVGNPRPPMPTVSETDALELRRGLVAVCGEAPFEEKRLVTSADLLRDA